MNQILGRKFLSLVEKIFTYSPATCKICRLLPYHVLALYTVEDSFYLKTTGELMLHYSELLPVGEVKLNNENVWQHRGHCHPKKLDAAEIELLGLSKATMRVEFTKSKKSKKKVRASRSKVDSVKLPTTREPRIPVFRAVLDHPELVFLKEALILAGCNLCSNASYATADRLGLKRVMQEGRQWCFSRAECIRVGKTRIPSSAQMELPLTTSAMINDVPVVTPMDIQPILVKIEQKIDHLTDDARIRDEKFARRLERLESIIRTDAWQTKLVEKLTDTGSDKTNGEQPPPQST